MSGLPLVGDEFAGYRVRSVPADPGERATRPGGNLSSLSH